MEPWSGYFSYQVRKLWYSFGKMREIPTRRVSCSYFIRYLREEVCRESEMCSDDIKH
uniref:Uncharacterized protein n=1 Tax=Brassica oleracea TaxID=3712 RepID=A0A3P6FD18_BRAOL|nr:unnamed protein product [Brassica oleracea]